MLYQRFVGNDNIFWRVFESDKPTVAFCEEGSNACPHMNDDGTVCGCESTPVFDHPAVEITLDDVAQLMTEYDRINIWCLIENARMDISRNKEE